MVLMSSFVYQLEAGNLCYWILPTLFDRRAGRTDGSVVFVVSPLHALVKDQIETLTRRGATAVYAGDANSDAIAYTRQGCGGPLSVCVHQPRNAADRTTVVRHDCVTSLVVFVVDEAH